MQACGALSRTRAPNFVFRAGGDDGGRVCLWLCGLVCVKSEGETEKRRERESAMLRGAAPGLPAKRPWCIVCTCCPPPTPPTQHTPHRRVHCGRTPHTPHSSRAHTYTTHHHTTPRTTTPRTELAIAGTLQDGATVQQVNGVIKAAKGPTIIVRCIGDAAGHKKFVSRPAHAHAHARARTHAGRGNDLAAACHTQRSPFGANLPGGVRGPTWCLVGYT